MSGFQFLAGRVDAKRECLEELMGCCEDWIRRAADWRANTE